MGAHQSRSNGKATVCKFSNAKCSTGRKTAIFYKKKGKIHKQQEYTQHSQRVENRLCRGTQTKESSIYTKFELRKTPPHGVRSAGYA